MVVMVVVVAVVMSFLLCNLAAHPAYILTLQHEMDTVIGQVSCCCWWW